MRATFVNATDFFNFDISVWSDRSGSAKLATGSFTLNGETYENRYLLPLLNNFFTLSILGDDLIRSGGILTDGTIGAFRLLTANGAQVISLEDLDLSADTLHDVIRTDDTADDRALLNLMLAGNDSINLSAEADRAFGANGNDSLSGFGGADTLLGNNGNDWLYGGDRNDSLIGHNGADRLFGGLGADKLTGGLGADVLTGGGGADVFLFTSSDGKDVIRDFQDNIDTIDINILPAGEWQVDLQPDDGDTILTIFRVDNPNVQLVLEITIENINPTQMTDDILL